MNSNTHASKCVSPQNAIYLIFADRLALRVPGLPILLALLWLLFIRDRGCRT